MASAIGLLTLALSLLTAVQQNPQLPPAFREQAISVAQTAIAEAAKAQSTPVPVHPEYRASVGGTIDGMSIDVFKIAREEDSIYYRGDKEIVSATVNGEAAEITMSKAMSEDSCVNIWDGGEHQGKKCGGFMARVSAPAGSGTIVLTAADADTYETTF